MNQIEDVLPHRGESLWLNEIVSLDEELACVFSKRTDDLWPSTEQGLPWWAAVELMAQAAAVWAGGHNIKLGREQRLGFLLGSRKVECSADYFPSGHKLKVEARPLLIEDDGVSVFECRVEGGGVIALANIKAVQPADPRLLKP
jgi:predicted hotdog family 3-hydroxylacyl-ACP dehydratase